MESKFEYFMEQTNEQLGDIKKDVRSLLEFKWKALGALVVVNVLMVLAIEIFKKT